ncbi:peptidoglycan-associated lipoprotein Pal [Bacteriovoracaceae bacterium]|nr:peptidoglycan-associated lipoprotein Pal [Bacteriovoracaceae bacterium]
MKHASLLLLALTFVFYSCGSSDKKTGSESAAEDVVVEQPNGDSNGLALELNGDSDSNTAGGISTVYFDYDSSSLTSSSKQVLEQNAQFLKTSDKIDIQIEGHCDERGGIQYNLALGERRARAIRDYLVALGVTRSRMKIVSFGKERPVSFGHDESSWGRNRRGNFVITAK